jgi:hypothetical protein
MIRRINIDIFRKYHVVYKCGFSPFPTETQP